MTKQDDFTLYELSNCMHENTVMLNYYKLKDQHFKLREALNKIKYSSKDTNEDIAIATQALEVDTKISDAYYEHYNDYFRWWVNREIPAWLDKFTCFEDFHNAMPSACARASIQWKMVAYAMAKERWNVKEINYIPR